MTKRLNEQLSENKMHFMKREMRVSEERYTFTLHDGYVDGVRAQKNLTLT